MLALTGKYNTEVSSKVDGKTTHVFFYHKGKKYSASYKSLNELQLFRAYEVAREYQRSLKIPLQTKL